MTQHAFWPISQQLLHLTAHARHPSRVNIDADLNFGQPFVTYDDNVARLVKQYWGSLVTESYVPTLQPYFNKVLNPSSENGLPITSNWSGSSAGQPAATNLADSTRQARYGTWTTHYVATRTDGASITNRTGAALTALSAIAGNYYMARCSGMLNAPLGLNQNVRCRIYWYQPDGTASAIATVTDGPNIPNPVPGIWYDHFVVGQAPADAAFASTAYLISSLPGGGQYTADISLDAYSLINLGGTWTNPVAAATRASDMIPWFSGDFPNGAWTGGSPYTVNSQWLA